MPAKRSTQKSFIEQRDSASKPHPQKKVVDISSSDAQDEYSRK
jgi:hypothetical protein